MPQKYTPMPFSNQDSPGPSRSWLSRRVGITIAILSVLLLSLFYIEVSHHGRADINLDLDDQTALTEAPAAAVATPSESAVAETSPTSSPTKCTVGDLYGSCFNDIRFFQCTPDGPLPRPCPAGQKFFCTGEGTGECGDRHAELGKGFEMLCDGKEELGACRKSN